MGLGKTRQAILGLERVHASKFLVICPSIARINWLREIQMWSDILTLPKVYFGLKEKIDFEIPAICSFDFATENKERLVSQKWDCVIVDEGHFLKNLKAKRTKAILGLNGILSVAKRMWLLTGTPAPNNPSELWVPLFVFGQTRMSFDQFTNHFCLTRKTTYGVKITGTRSERIPELKNLLKPVLLRRLKKDVMKELPPINYYHEFVEPGLVDLPITPTFCAYTYPTDRTDELVKTIRQQRFLVEQMILRTQSDPEGAIAGMEGIAKSVSTLRRMVGLQKVDAAVDMIQAGFKAGVYQKLVVFAIHQDVIDGIMNGLRAFGIDSVKLYGGTPAKKRQRNIDKFNSNPRCKVFIGQILSAGTAINLTIAHDVMFVEQDWVPGNNAQAIMRCHRIGQKKTVSVKFLALEDSIDSHVTLLLKKKTRDLMRIFDENGLSVSNSFDDIDSSNTTTGG